MQSPTNPLAVTYFYSASATVGSENEPNLPGGILNLYSDGLLACSINVGGSITGGECLVTYQAAGPQTVVVIYSSDSVSVTETYTENIEKPEPPPLLYTILYCSIASSNAAKKKKSSLVRNIGGVLTVYLRPQLTNMMLKRPNALSGSSFYMKDSLRTKPRQKRATPMS